MHCINCRYDLSEADPAGRCPECGLAIAESTGPHRHWTARRLRAALWLCRLIGAFAALALLGQALRAVLWVAIWAADVSPGPAIVALGVTMALGALALLGGASLMAWVVACSGPRGEMPERKAVPAIILAGVGMLTLAIAVALVATVGPVTVLDRVGIWPLLFIDASQVAFLSALMLAPLVAARAVVVSGAVGRGTRPVVIGLWGIRLACGLVLLGCAVGVALATIFGGVVGTTESVDQHLLGWLAESLRVAHAAINLALAFALAVVGLGVGQALTVRLASFDAARSERPTADI